MKFSRKPVQWEPSWHVRTDGNMTKRIRAYCDYAKAPKYETIAPICLVLFDDVLSHSAHTGSNDWMITNEYWIGRFFEKNASSILELQFLYLLGRTEKHCLPSSSIDTRKKDETGQWESTIEAECGWKVQKIRTMKTTSVKYKQVWNKW